MPEFTCVRIDLAPSFYHNHVLPTLRAGFMDEPSVVTEGNKAQNAVLTLLSLPIELIHHILTLLDPFDLFACRLTGRFLNELIRESVPLQYDIALTLAKADDNPCSLAPLSEKLQDLQSSEESWCTLQPKFIVNVPIQHETSGIYDLSGGTYLLGNWDKRALQYMSLPTKKDDAIIWNKVSVPATIIDMGFCVFEHDLITVITTTPTGEMMAGQPLFAIEMHLLEYSTSRPHPQAKQHRILITNSVYERPAIMCETVGENLVLLLTCTGIGGREYDDRIVMFDWRNSLLKATLTSINKTYFGFIMLAEDLVLFPNNKTNAFDIFRIPSRPTPDPLQCIFSLSLPALADGNTISHITCRAEPNPIGHASRLDKRHRAEARAEAGMNERDPFAPKRGFLSSSDEAICIFQLKLRGEPLVIPQIGINVHFEMGHTFTFFIRRKSFLETVEKYEDSFSVAPVDVEMGELAGISPMEEDTVAPAPPSAAPPNGTANPNSPPINPVGSLPTGPRRVVPWAEWGPPASRWFNADAFPSRWITTSAGQRCVVIHEEARAEGSPIMVIDFNPYTLKKMKKRVMLARETAEARLVERRKRREARRKKKEEDEKSKQAMTSEKEGKEGAVNEDNKTSGDHQRDSTLEKGKAKAADSSPPTDEKKKPPNKALEQARAKLEELKAWRTARAKAKAKAASGSSTSIQSSVAPVSVTIPRKKRPLKNDAQEDHDSDSEDEDAGAEEDVHTPLPLDQAGMEDQPLVANLLGNGTPNGNVGPAGFISALINNANPAWNIAFNQAIALGAPNTWNPNIQLNANVTVNALPPNAMPVNITTTATTSTTSSPLAPAANSVAGPSTSNQPQVLVDDDDDDWLTEPDSDVEMPTLQSVSSDGEDTDDGQEEDYEENEEDEDDDEYHDAMSEGSSNESMPNLEEVSDSDDEEFLDILQAQAHSTSSGGLPPYSSLSSHPDSRHPGRARVQWVDIPTRVDARRSFAEPVEGRLPYVAYISERQYGYDGVLADEERIIGIKTDAIDRIRSIDIFYFG
ncbi:hypothetical protein CPB83DRAFT_50481 [Crepidotus variabilis]|uniref:F-box domain-containing protein n=1 Tax=Crepidotus variabilis TaxID=179855 RepID=A0A9P6EMT8_9AGAR|nr:hypothetical protein CPB83DRAFT_50481 [Crepidotus variabilis]